MADRPQLCHLLHLWRRFMSQKRSPKTSARFPILARSERFEGHGLGIPSAGSARSEKVRRALTNALIVSLWKGSSACI